MNTLSLSKSRQNEIDLAVSDMLCKLDKGYPENSLVEIANANGVEVYLVEGISGILRKDCNTPKIHLNNKQSKTGLTLALAHELGHCLLHDWEEQLEDRQNHIRQDSSEEIEADYFVVSLLVPKDKLTKILRETKVIDAIAKYFGVSNSEITTTFKILERDIYT